MQHPMRIVDRCSFPCWLQQERHVLIMTGILPIDEEAVPCYRKNERPYDPEDKGWHALAKEHHSNGRDQCCDVECTCQQVGAYRVAVICLKVIEECRYMVDTGPHKRNIAADKDRFHQTTHPLCYPGLVCLHVTLSFLHLFLTVCSWRSPFSSVQVIAIGNRDLFDFIIVMPGEPRLFRDCIHGQRFIFVF